MYVSLSLDPLMPPLQRTQNPQQPSPSPLIFSLLILPLLLSTTPALYLHGEKGQGHEDKHRKVKVDERETES